MKQQAVTSLTVVCGTAPACLEAGRWRRIPAQVPGSRRQTLEEPRRVQVRLTYVIPARPDTAAAGVWFTGGA